MSDENVQPENGLSKEARNWGMACHLAGLAGYTGIPLASVIAPLVIWLIKKEQIPFVDDQGKESLNFQITVAIAILVCLPLICLGGLGAFLLIGVAIFDVIMIIIASIKASNGESYRYPVTIRFIK